MKKSYVLPDLFAVTAHTGCHGTKDNSIESIERAISSGAQILEFDLRFDAQGNGILSHDKGEADPVSLEDAFAVISRDGKIKVNIDCKTTDNLKEVCRLSEKYALSERIFYTGIEKKDVESVKNQTPEVAYFLNFSPKKLRRSSEKYIKEVIALVKETGAIGLNVKFTHCSKKMVEMFRRENLQVSLWTANKEKDMHRCLAMAPDNITTRYPETLLEFIK